MGIQVGRGSWGLQCSTLTKRAQGAQAGLTDCTPHPLHLGTSKLCCLTACLASPGINGGVHSAQTQEGWNQGNIVLLLEENCIYIRHSWIQCLSLCSLGPFLYFLVIFLPSLVFSRTNWRCKEKQIQNQSWRIKHCSHDLFLTMKLQD